MHIKEYMFRKEINQLELSRLLGVAPSFLCRVLKGKQKFDPKLALQIEQFTKGLVTRDECLFPEKYPDWRL